MQLGASEAVQVSNSAVRRVPRSSVLHEDESTRAWNTHGSGFGFAPSGKLQYYLGSTSVSYICIQS